jgi:hypothetical protein
VVVLICLLQVWRIEECVCGSFDLSVTGVEDRGECVVVLICLVEGEIGRLLVSCCLFSS